MAAMKILAFLSLVALAVAAGPAFAANDGAPTSAPHDSTSASPTDPSASPAKPTRQRHAHQHKKNRKGGTGDHQPSPQGSNPAPGG
jgi:hypothetical protein